MISFRFLLVSIVAVLLALALGVLAGTAVISPRLIRELERETEQWQGRAERLQGEVEVLDAFLGEALPYLTEDRLLGTEAVVVTQDGVDPSLLAAARRALTEAGAAEVAVLSARPELASTDPEVERRLSDLLGHPAAPPEELSALAAQALATRLAIGASRRGSGPDEPDVLRELLEAGFVASIGPDLADLREVGGPDQVVVVVAGGEGDPSLPPSAFLLPLARALVSRGAWVAAAEGVESSYGFVAALREDGSVSGQDVVTVDDLDAAMGAAALVLGLERLIDLGRGGHYGVHGDSLIPAPAA
ncbi:MAG TPA: copper transporter [Actinomycetota bacterium]|nr:copper transporter [Actinomycetota bacterium]